MEDVGSSPILGSAEKIIKFKRNRLKEKLWRLHHSIIFALSSGPWCYACTRNKCTHTKTTMLWLAQLLMYFTSYQVCSGSCFPIAEAVIAVSFSMKDALIKPS